MMCHETKFGCQRINSSENMVESHILIKWALVVIATLKLAKTTTKNSAWHSGSWCFITIPNLVTKYFVIQKISFRQTFTDILNLCCDLHLERSNPIFPQDTLAYNAVLSNQVYLQTDKQFRRYWPNKHSLTFLIFAVTLTLNAVIPFSTGHSGL